MLNTRQKGSWWLILVIMIGFSACKNQDIVPDSELDHANIALTIWTDQTELFFEYPPMVAGREGGTWAVHITRMADFKPVTEGRLIVKMQSADGRDFSFESDAPARPGIFLPAPSVEMPGDYLVSIEVISPQLTDKIAVGNITVFAESSQIPPDEEEGGGVSFLKEQQWPIDFGVQKVGVNKVFNTTKVTGSIFAADGRIASVSVPVSGILTAADNLNAPSPGDQVRKGQFLAKIASTRGENSYATAFARVEKLTRDAARLERLFAAEAIPEKLIIEARHDLELAQAALQGMGGDSKDGFSFIVTAPIDGIVSSRALVLGDYVEVGKNLFTLHDPSKVWLRINLPSRYASIARTLKEISFTLEGSTDRYTTSRIVSVGDALDSDTRTLPVVFEVDNSNRALKLGLFVEGLALVGGLTEGITIPSSAIQFEDGQPVAYVQTGGESFQRRALVIGPTDGKNTIVSSGLNLNEYVVTTGAYQVYLGSLGNSEFGEGHAH